MKHLSSFVCLSKGTVLARVNSSSRLTWGKTFRLTGNSWSAKSACPCECG